MLSTILFVAINIVVNIHARSTTNMVRQARSLSSNFDEIVVEGDFNVFLIQVPSTDASSTQLPSLEVETTTDGQRQLVAEVRSGHILTLRIDGSLNIPEPCQVFIRFTGPLRRYSAAGSGSTMTQGNGIVNPPNESLVLRLAGSCTGTLTLDVPRLDVFVEGSGLSQFTGTVRDQAIFRVQGSRSIDASNLSCTRASVRVEGDSSLTVSATEDIDISAAGVSKVSYRLLSQKQPSRSSVDGLATITRLQ